MFSGQNLKVHCITNSVVQNFVANGLQAISVEPSMSNDPDEVADFLCYANALSINLGTLNPLTRKAIDIAVTSARYYNLPWTLDAPFLERSPLREKFARHLVSLEPDICKINHREAANLFARDEAEDVGNRTCTWVTGPNDRIRLGKKSRQIEGGHIYMSVTTGMGCLAGAIAAAALCIHADALVAASSAARLMNRAGSLAGGRSDGPGTFAVRFIDALHEISHAQ